MTTAIARVRQPFLLVTTIPTSWLSAGSIAVAVALALAEPSRPSTTVYYLLAVWLGFLWAPKRLSWAGWVPKTLLIAVALIGASAIIAVPVSASNSREFTSTAILAMATLVLIPLFFVTNVREILTAMIPLWYLQAALTAFQWFVGWSSRPYGLAVNANAGSSFLLLGAVFLATNPRLKWLAVPLAAAIPFGGSRWVAVVAAMVFAGIFLHRRVPWRYLMVGMAAALTLVVSTSPDKMAVAYRLGDSVNETVEVNMQAAAWRLTLAHGLADWRALIPQGFVRESQLHNVPVRMAVETGLLSAVAWAVVGALTLVRRPGQTVEWWMLLTVGLLSVMYYHTWVGPLGVFWWILVGGERGMDREREREGN